VKVGKNSSAGSLLHFQLAYDAFSADPI